MIAMALAGRPKLLIADEPTTALDVTVQAQVLALLRDLQRRTGVAVILITHDMGVVAEMATRVLVMRSGRKVEEAPVRTLFAAPEAPYTRELLDAVPRLGSTASLPDRPPPGRPARLRGARPHGQLRRARRPAPPGRGPAPRSERHRLHHRPGRDACARRRVRAAASRRPAGRSSTSSPGKATSG